MINEDFSVKMIIFNNFDCFYVQCSCWRSFCYTIYV